MDDEHLDMMDFVTVVSTGMLGRIWAVDRINNRYEVIFREAQAWYDRDELALHTPRFFRDNADNA